MTLKALILAIVTSLLLTANTQANDINSSWDVRVLKGQAVSQTIKKLKFKKFVIRKSQTQEIMSGQIYTKKNTIKKHPIIKLQQ